MFLDRTSWRFWLLALAGSILLYAVLILLQKSIKYLVIFGRQPRRPLQLLQEILKVYEPIALIVLTIIFVFINPMMHGLPILILLIVGFHPIKNYMTGRFFILTQNLKKNEEIKVRKYEGIVQKLGRMGIYLQAQNGLHFISYHELLSKGYTILRRSKVARFHKISIQKEGEEKEIDQQLIMNKLFLCPYIDWSYKPQLKVLNQEKSQYSLEVQTRKDKHLIYLIELINEWGYTCHQLN